MFYDRLSDYQITNQFQDILILLHSDSCKKKIKTCNLVYMGIIWLQRGQYLKVVKKYEKPVTL
jgi:hypothetical protein